MSNIQSLGTLYMNAIALFSYRYQICLCVCLA